MLPPTYAPNSVTTPNPQSPSDLHLQHLPKEEDRLPIPPHAKRRPITLEHRPADTQRRLIPSCDHSWWRSFALKSHDLARAEMCKMSPKTKHADLQAQDDAQARQFW